MDVYTQDGNIIRQFPNQDGTTEVELEFIFQDLFWSQLYGISIFYITFYKRLGINYVTSSYNFTKAVLRQEDFDERTQEELIQTLLVVKENSNMLIGTANKHLFDQPDSGNVETNQLDSLKPYKVIEVEGRNFLEKFAERLEKKLIQD